MHGLRRASCSARFSGCISLCIQSLCTLTVLVADCGPTETLKGCHAGATSRRRAAGEHWQAPKLVSRSFKKTYHSVLSVVITVQAEFGEEEAKPAKAERVVGDVNAIPLGQRPQESRKPPIELEPVPNVEWWDARLLRNPKVRHWPQAGAPREPALRACHAHTCCTAHSWHRQLLHASKDGHQPVAQSWQGEMERSPAAHPRRCASPGCDPGSL